MLPPERRAGIALAAVALLALSGCHGLSDARAEALVRRYNEKLIAAYRFGDQRIVEGLVGDDEAKKLLGLIGVKADLGITLDATLTEFRVTGTQRPARDTVEVLTEERWHYRDRRIGSGETVGEESDDHYFMRYTLARSKAGWVVARVAFDRPPEVGRSEVSVRASPRVFHGMPEPAAPPPPGGTGEKGRTP